MVQPLVQLVNGLSSFCYPKYGEGYC